MGCCNRGGLPLLQGSRILQLQALQSQFAIALWRVPTSLQCGAAEFGFPQFPVITFENCRRLRNSAFHYQNVTLSKLQIPRISVAILLEATTIRSLRRVYDCAFKEEESA